ncbi:MAG: indole-3-glycerol phosphate synthase TrpC [Sediminibacterium sp.]|nr:indole-3-glycerol phosphate synthase TrpC [Sediminibacterium sp.]
MSHILDKIIDHKKTLLAQAQLVQQFQPLNIPPKYLLKDTLIQATRPQIITEFKRQSPSKGIINNQADLKSTVENYIEYGAAAVSILTDEKYFGGHLSDLMKVSHLPVPFLRKEFIIDESQIFEAQLAGASIILLIAAVLEPKRVYELAKFAHELHLEVLLEIHEVAELGHINEYIDILGVNNRNLKNFQVDINISMNILTIISQESGFKLPLISESGIDHIDTVKSLFDNGCKGFLIGENFMKHPQPGLAFRNFNQALQQFY